MRRTANFTNRATGVGGLFGTVWSFGSKVLSLGALTTVQAAEVDTQELQQKKAFNKPTQSTQSTSGLMSLLNDGNHRKHKFRLQLETQKENLTATEVKQLAAKAVKTGHAEELDALVGAFPEVLDEDYLSSELSNASSSSIFGNMLVARSGNKLNHLNSFFGESEKLSIVEEDDVNSLQQEVQGLRTQPQKRIAVVDSDQYSSSHFFLSRNGKSSASSYVNSVLERTGARFETSPRSVSMAY